jgi:DNA repair exonuclease SbcCD nuclease subunit
MKIFMTADLHYGRPWFEWLVEQAPQYDLVCVAGDLLDMFGIDEQGQIDYLRREWLPAMARAGTPVALSSGNHDHAMISWLYDINITNGIAGDGHTQLLTFGHEERLIITTCPYYRSFNLRDTAMTASWEEGARLRHLTNAPWLVMHHEPLAPDESYVATHFLGHRLRQFRPTYVLSGHFHEMDEFAGRRWGAWLFNAGQRLDAPKPNHLILDTSANTITRIRMVPLPHSLSWVEERVFDFLET